MTSFWPTSVQGQTWLYFLSLLAIVLVILIVEYVVFDRVLDWWQRDPAKQQADALKKLQAEMAHEAQAQAVRRAQLEIVSRTGTRR